MLPGSKLRCRSFQESSAEALLAEVKVMHSHVGKTSLVLHPTRISKYLCRTERMQGVESIQNSPHTSRDAQMGGQGNLKDFF